MPYQKIKTMEELWQKLTPDGFEAPKVEDFEKSILGSLLFEKAVGEKVFEMIGERTVEDSPFYFHKHTLIYLAAFSLFRESRPFDPMNVTERLREHGTLAEAGGPAYLHDLVVGFKSQSDTRSNLL